MSDMSHVYNAYAAVHDSEKRNNLSGVRDQISEMTLTQLTDLDLYEVAEEVLEEVFSKGTGVAEAQELVESVFYDKASECDISPIRVDKLERLAEAFDTAFVKVKERSLRTAVESYSEYRRNKERLEKWNDSNSTGNINHKLHARLVGEDRLVVKSGLKSMIDEGALVKAAQGVEKVGGAIAKGARAIDKADKAVTKATMNRVVKPVAKGLGRAAKSTVKAAGRAFVGGVKGAVKGALNKEAVQSPAAKEEKLRKYEVTYDGHVAELGKIRERALKKGAWSAAVNAETNRGKAAGLYIDRKIIKTGKLEDMSEEELEAKMKQILDDYAPLLNAKTVEGEAIEAPKSSESSSQQTSESSSDPQK